MSDPTPDTQQPLHTDAPASAIIDRAADLIETRGWTSGACGWNEPDPRPGHQDGPLCIEGALQAATGHTLWMLCAAPEDVYGLEHFYASRAYAAVAEHLGQDPADERVWEHNDNSDRVAVLAMLRAVAATEHAREQAEAVAQ